tara:strand:+ start:1722 stop:3062 length:1341 start_codon:yes stop_codon:yes gene_type:complete
LKTKQKYIFSLFIKIFIFLVFLFARTFTGLTFFGYRLGEYIIGGSALLLIIFTIFVPILKKKFLLESKSINMLCVLLILSFAISNIVNSVSFSNELIYKSSSYIWSFGAIIIGYYILSEKYFIINKEDSILSFFGLFIIYIFSTRGISENSQNFFLNYTDKFEYPKGSDLLLAFIFIFYIFLSRKKFSQNSLIIFLLIGAMYTPLFMVKSRSAFLSVLIFCIILFPEFKKNIKKLDKYFYISIVFSLIIFALSSSWVVSRDISVDEEITGDIKFAITSRYSTINDNVYEETVLNISLFYFRDGRIFSSDGNLNWRLQIWQDILTDMWKSKDLINGYGYHDLIPAMNSDQRLGQDGTNVNVHNYIIHIVSRGGLIHFSFIVLIYFFLFQKFKHNSYQTDYKLLVFPLIFNSLFDPSMENAHYSIIMYILIGLALNNRIILKEENHKL